MYYILDLADKEFEKAIGDSPALEKAVNTHNGKMIHLYRLNGPKGINDGLD